MRKFIISITLLLLTTGAWACGGPYPTHNAYLFSVIHRDLMDNEVFTDRIDKFWQTYTNGAVKRYRWNEDEILELAKKKGDNEMVNYLNSLNKYLDISKQLQEEWTYPTKEELAQRKVDLNNIIVRGKGYKGSRLKAQWELLVMRAYMVLGQHTNNINYWKQRASRLPESVYRDMARNIYAGALLHTGNRSEACDIYAEQGDMVSVKWALRKHRNLAGIKSVVAENPKSPAIPFLVQDFVNNTQETIDTGGDKDAIDWVNARLILRNEAMNFISYAQGLVDNKKTDCPALWLAAIGELQFLFGQNNEAMATLNKAVDAQGTERMKDNARAIRMVVSANASKIDSQYSQWITNELKWLAGKINVGSPNPQGYDPDYDYHYVDVLERLVYNNLAPKYRENGHPDIAAMLIFMTERGNMLKTPEFIGEGWNPNYSSDFYQDLYELDANQLLSVVKQIKEPSNDALKNYAKQFFTADDNYFNDLVGTRFLAEGKFAEALKYLDQVPANYYEKLNLSYYMKNRDYTKARWLDHQVDKEDEVTEGPNLAKLTTNRRADFCREMNNLLERYTTANNETRPQVAYDLAKRYYQASCWGDCWWLSDYGHSVYDSARVNRPDFVQKAIDYLQQSKLTTDATLHLNSLYALAFIPQDPWCSVDFDFNTNKYIYTPLRGTRQFKALDDLNNYARQHSAQMPAYVSRCDVLKQFRAVN